MQFDACAVNFLRACTCRLVSCCCLHAEPAGSCFVLWLLRSLEIDVLSRHDRVTLLFSVLYDGMKFIKFVTILVQLYFLHHSGNFYIH